MFTLSIDKLALKNYDLPSNKSSKSLNLVKDPATIKIGNPKEVGISIADLVKDNNFTVKVASKVPNQGISIATNYNNEI